MDEDTESLNNVDVRLYGFFCRSCKKEIEFGQATCSCGKNVVTGLPWSVVVVLGILIAAIAYPTMIAIWLYALMNLISEFIPRAAMAIIISTAILGPVFVVIVPLAKAARVVVAPLGPNRTHCTRLRIVNDLWNCKKEPHFEDLIDDIREVDRVPFLVSLNPESHSVLFRCSCQGEMGYGSFLRQTRQGYACGSSDYECLGIDWRAKTCCRH